MTGPLTEQARLLGERIAGLSLAVEQLDRRTNRSEKITIGVVFGLILDLILSVAVALVLGAQFSTNAKLEDANTRLEATVTEGICPVYGLVLGSYNPLTRKEGAERDAYVQSFKVMNEAYKSLKCPTAIVPPRSDQTPQPVPSR